METTSSLTLAECQERRGTAIVPTSFVSHDGAAFWLEVERGERSLLVAAPNGHSVLQHFQGEASAFDAQNVVVRCATNLENGRALRAALPWLRPMPIGLRTSAGFGDRLGLATPGHVRALQKVLAERPTADIVPIFAQQSIREMGRTHRTPEEILTDATWGTFQEGWRGGVGADADHLKTPEDIDICAEQG